MTKKIFAMFLAVLMVVSVLPISVFAAEATCPGEGNEHTMSNCNSYDVVKVTDPNCGTKGFTTYKCKTCGELFVSNFTDPVGEHVWKAAEDKAPTCEKPGSTGGKECEICHTVVGATEVPALGNGLKCEYTEWSPAAIDCTVGGTQTRNCKNCGHIETRTFEKDRSEHKWASEWTLKTPATATSNGLAVKACECVLTNQDGDTVKCDAVLEQEVFFSHDHNDATLIEVAEVAATCDKAGTKAHFVCRICGEKFIEKSGAYEKVTDASKLVIESKHDGLKKQLSCVTTTVPCPDCDAIIKLPAIEHKFETYTVEKDPTCTLDGYKKSTCSVCKKAVDVQIIPALGHIEGTVTVAATCKQYGYTYTYCLRPDCGNYKIEHVVKINGSDVTFDLTQGSANATAPVVGKGFYLSVNQKNLDKTLYFTGEMGGNNNKFFATTEDIDKAVQVYLEEVAGKDGEYRMYFNSGSDKMYIAVVKSGNYMNVKFGKDYTETWTWNEKYGVLTTKVDNTEYYIGTYGTFNTMSASKVSYLENPDNSFASQMTFTNEGGVQLLDFTANTTAGVDSTNHKWVVSSTTPATHDNKGAVVYYCANGCGVATKTEELPVITEHNWVKDTSKADKPATCTEAGKEYKICNVPGCSEKKEITIAAKGHEAKKDSNGKVIKEHYAGTHEDRVSYDYNICANCKDANGNPTVFNKTNFGGWDKTGKLWADLAAARAAHGAANLKENDAASIAGSCTVEGYAAYNCSLCGEVVHVKEDDTGSHKFPAKGWTIGNKTYTQANQAPTCTEKGYSINYKCETCGKLVDETKAEGITWISATGHTWKEFTAEQRKNKQWLDDKYTPTPCEQFRPDNWTHYCSVCNKNCEETGALKADQTLDQANTSVLVQGSNLCEIKVYQTYTCHCGKTHMRNFLEGGVNVDHNWVNATENDITNEPNVEDDANGKPILKKDATCTAAGYEWFHCTFCNKNEQKEIAKIPHKNKDDVKFTESCLDDDKTTDRHCVLCCACKDKTNHDCTADQDANTEGKQTCACVIPTGKHNNKKTYVSSICGELPKWYEVCQDCFKTEAADATEYVDANGNKAPIDLGLGHKPVAADVVDGNEEQYIGYKYEEYPHITYEWVIPATATDAAYVKRVESAPYTAKFIAYTAPTYTSKGYAKFVCADCGQTIETEIPELSGLGVELDAYNANGTGSDVTYGSLVAVDVSLNSLSTNVFGFMASVEIPDDSIFVGYEKKAENFNIDVTEPLDAYDDVIVHAYAVNDANGKRQNIVIDEKTTVATLFFRVVSFDYNKVDPDTQEVSLFVDFQLGDAQAWDLAHINDKDFAEVNCSDASAELNYFFIGDFNRDLDIHPTDAYSALTLLTGENADGKTYDVTVDFDKDGVITAYDLTVLYQYLVENVDEEEIFLYGISAEEQKLLEEMFDDEMIHCNNSQCDFEANKPFTVCPVCGNIQ